MASKVSGCLLIFWCFLLTSCATPGTSTRAYIEPPPGKPINNERIVAKPFSETWDLLVGELSKSFFLINNIDKASRIINVSFSTNQPKQYVNCGQSVRELSYNGALERFEYQIADSSEYKEAGNWGEMNHLPLFRYVSRRPSLEGRANIYVAPRGDSETLITTNVRYIFSVRVHGTVELRNAADGAVSTTPFEKIGQPVSFNTNQAGEAEFDKNTGKAAFICRSTGLLESQMLELGNPLK